MKSAVALILCTVLILAESQSKSSTNTGNFTKSIFKAARDGDVAIIKEMIKYGINIDGKDNRGQTALHIAARFDQEAVAQLLIRNGANLEIEDYELQTPLYRAVCSEDDNDGITDLLIRRGAEINPKNYKLLTPLSRAVDCINYRNVNLLIRRGADITLQIPKNSGYTVLHQATKKGFVRMVAWFVRNPTTDINLHGTLAHTPIFYASVNSDAGIIELLIKNGADINLQDKDGLAAIHGAAMAALTTSTSILLKYHADINIKTNEGKTALDIANDRGSSRISELLKTHPVKRSSEEACETYRRMLPNRDPNGIEAKNWEFASMAALGYIDTNDNYKLKFSCAGTLISEYFILTSAQCATVEKPPVKARLGKVSLRNENGLINHQIKEVIRYRFYSNVTKKHDIALLRLFNRVQFSEDIFPACLQTDSRDEARNVSLISYGWRGVSSDSIDLTLTLVKAKLKTMPLSMCNKTYLCYNKHANLPYFENGISSGQYCACDLRNKKCHGLNGGPIQIVSPISTVVGVASHDLNCAMPGIYTRVAHYLSWIEANVWSDQYLKLT